jgi:hypothetical protein
MQRVERVGPVTQAGGGPAGVASMVIAWGASTFF